MAHVGCGMSAALTDSPPPTSPTISARSSAVSPRLCQRVCQAHDESTSRAGRWFDDNDMPVHFDAKQRRKALVQFRHLGLRQPFRRTLARRAAAGVGGVALRFTRDRQRDLHRTHQTGQTQLRRGCRGLLPGRPGPRLGGSGHAGDLGIIPGSMGADSFIVEGLGNELSWSSCSYGAGGGCRAPRPRGTCRPSR